jgi:hypothetical protein
MTKTCTICGQEKDIAEFGTYLSKLKGYRKRYYFTYCRHCHLEKNKHYRDVVMGKA